MGATPEQATSTPSVDPADVTRRVADGDADVLVAQLATLPGPEVSTAIERIADSARGARTLVDLRHEVLAHRGDDPTLDPLDRALRAALDELFGVDRLDLRSIGPDAPADLLDRLTAYEAVHPVRGRDDLMRRLHPDDRRCLALFHADLDDDPVIFVEVALTLGIEASVQAVLDAPPPLPERPAPDTAIFYSINNCQGGLRGIPFGAELLHRSMAELAATTDVTRFSTLSPIPGFARWLDPVPSEPDALLAACARYLLTAKRDTRPLDPVARFHLGNGARLERLNLDGDTSERGVARYLGVTANYLYEPTRLDERRTSYERGEVVASDAVLALAAAP